MKLRQGITVVVALGALVALAPAAQAETFKGKTSGGKTVKLRTSKTDRVKSISTELRFKCRRTGASFVAPMGARRPFDFLSRERFADRDSFGGRENKLRIRFRYEVEGERKTDQLWKGTYESRVKVTRRGKPVDTCRSGKVNWYAKAKG